MCANLLKDKSADYYSNVISIINSNELSDIKLNMMADLNKNFAENTSAIVK